MNVPNLSATDIGSKKRSHDGQFILAPSTPEASTDSHVSSSRPSFSPRQASPALSTCSSLTSLAPSISQGQSSGPNGKKRKLTFAERQVEAQLKREEKEAKEKQREEEKARRDEEKRRKEEEKEAARIARDLENTKNKQKRDAEKQAKEELKAKKEEERQKRDAEKQAKEDLKARKEEERQKKERSQMRIGAFFGRPSAASTPPSSPVDPSSGFSSRRSSIAELDIEMPLAGLEPIQNVHPEYAKMFPPFFVFENTDIAPANRFLRSAQLKSSCPYRLPEFPRLDVDTPLTDLRETFQAPARKRRRITASVRDLVDQIQGTSQAPINPTSEAKQSDPFEQLDKIPVKIISFFQDVRPPYQGTFTRTLTPRLATKIAKNPVHRILPDTDYDYDSEAEWEEPSKDDDSVNMEDEDSESEADEEEGMDDFLDDEDDLGKRRMLVGEMEPVSSGLCWEGDASTTLLREYQMDVLDDGTNLPIDPYSTEYWVVTSNRTPLKSEIKTEKPAIMQPPRLPLSTVKSPNTLLVPGFVSASQLNQKASGSENMAPGKQKAGVAGTGKPVKLISQDLLPAFKEAICGSNLTKAGLVEVLKKKFPKVSKDTIKDSISAVANREGQKEADKRWVLI